MRPSEGHADVSILSAVRAARSFAVLCLLIATTGCDASTTQNRDVARLPDGFQIPKGAALVGPVMPELVGVTSQAGARVAPHHAWTAALEIDGRARGVYDALVGQARRAGFTDIPDAAHACVSVPDVDVGRSRPAGNGLNVLTCSAYSPDAGASTDGSRRLELVVASCKRCRPKVDVAQIHYSSGSGARRGPAVTELPVPEQDPSSQGYPDWTKFPGTRVLMNERYAARGCEASQLVVLAVDDADRTWRSVLQQLPGVQIVAAATTGGRRFRQALASDGPSQELVSLADTYRGAPAGFTMSHCEG